MKKLYFIINPISGTDSKNGIPRLVADCFHHDVFETTIRFTEYAGHATELTRQALANNTDYIVAVGGDGTVNEIARNMIHSPAALGIVPMGSGNGLARDLRIPFDTKKSLGVIAKGKVTAIDYCKANQYIFFCTCGVGFDASVSERFSGEKQRGSISYFKSVISEYLKFDSDNYEIFLDNEILKQKAFLITCANASQYGYNAYIAPQANIKDGKMDIAVMSPMNPLEAGPAFIQLFTKQLEKNSKFSFYQSTKAIITRSKPGIMHVDGEPVYSGRKIAIKTVPAGLNVIVPSKEDMDSPIQTQIHDIQSFFGEVFNWITDLSKQQSNQ